MRTESAILFRRLLGFLALFLLQGADVSASEESGPMPTSADHPVIPYAINDELKAWAVRLTARETSPWPKLRNISRALLDPGQIGLKEDLTRTPTALEAYRTRRANCVGFALLFVSLAHEANVPAFFVMVDDLGRSRRQDGLRVTEGHLAAAYGTADKLRIFDFAGETDGADYVVRPVTDLTAVALFYSNRGVEAMLDNREADAVTWLRQAVELEPSLASARINLGVALRRIGDLEGAEHSYQEALRIDPAAGAAYRSLAALLRLRGRHGEAQELLADASRFEEGDALSYLSLARRSLETGDVHEARSLYRKALDLARHEQP